MSRILFVKLCLNITDKPSRRMSPVSDSNQINSDKDHHKYQSDPSKRHLDQTSTTYLDDIPPPVIDDGVVPTPVGLLRAISEPEISKNGLQTSKQSTSKHTINNQSLPVTQTPPPLRPLGKHMYRDHIYIYIYTYIYSQ